MNIHAKLHPHQMMMATHLSSLSAILVYQLSQSLFPVAHCLIGKTIFLHEYSCLAPPTSDDDDDYSVLALSNIGVSAFSESIPSSPLSHW